jgi:predicted house-cleaning noncanonical NTP pyrophosphatase (MazG superfamily)
MPNNDDIQQLKEEIKLLELELYFKNQEIESLNKDIEWFKIQNLALASRPVTINNKNELMNQPSDQSQKISVGRDFKIDATNSVVNLRDIIGQVTNTINQIPTSPESEKSEIKELLKELQTAVDDPQLSEEEKKEVLEQIQSLAEAAQDPKNETMQKKAKKAVGFLKVISEGLEPAGKVVTTIKSIIPAILAFFGA